MVDIDSGTLVLFLILPAVLLFTAAAVFVVLVRRLSPPVSADEPKFVSNGDEHPRPWWGNPLLWLGVSALLLLLGLFVLPHFLPGVFIFLPFMWIGGGRRRTSAGDVRRTRKRGA